MSVCWLKCYLPVLPGALFLISVKVTSPLTWGEAQEGDGAVCVGRSWQCGGGRAPAQAPFCV